MPQEPKPENLAKLTPEQRKVYENWVAEREQTQPLMEQALAAILIGDHPTAEACYDQLDKLVPSVCEHNLSIWDNCLACTEIERTLFPELFNEDGERLDDLDSLPPLSLQDKKMLN